MARYLSLEWIDDLARGRAADDLRGGGRARDRRHPGGDGRPRGRRHLPPPGRQRRRAFGAGPAEPENVRFVQDWDTAVAVATSALNAQEAFISGRVRLTGDQELLLDSTPVFAALDRCSPEVRPDVRTMPELPEVQAHAERLTGVAGAVLARFTPLTFTAFKTATPAPDGADGQPLAQRRPAGQVPPARLRRRSPSSCT